jgi:hypothetical protein
VIALATRQEKGRSLDRRIERALRYLDAEVTPDMVALYRQSAVEEHGSVLAALEADEAAMREEHANK